MTKKPFAPQRRHVLQWGLAASSGLLLPPHLAANTPSNRPVLQVGPTRGVRSLAAAAREAKDGMRIEVDAGEYTGDVAVWTQHDLHLKAVGGRVHMEAAGANAQGKGTFVTSGRDMLIEGFDFSGAQVPDHNGAGIRLQAGSLSLRDCRFNMNENGVLTSNDPTVRLDIEDCEFGTIIRRDGKNHNIYVGAIGHLRVVGSYFHHGQSGHLLKSRAAVSHIFYNRLTDEIGGRASYEIDLPNGGVALVVGNVIQQSAETENPHIVSFGAEGYSGPRNELHLINNTLIDMRPSNGVFLRVSPGADKVRLINNLWAGNPKVPADPAWESAGNFAVDLNVFVLASRDNYHLRPDAKVRGKAVDPGEVDGLSLRPTRQFLAPRGTLALERPAIHPGAFQFP
ncbi:right-handed parallel beta-helix repeat-containing protein [Roseateles koreensis]|uniref:Right handed beta helix domain-containing protein n=1 Tax=Roseateles koreensis TaxID=2987526 RepID=A0ABT5KUY9_9BURK|nr:hypothetical protein [Roseateles koreensis]MDC8786631.1 hypothetical protein [Roseateles koreensis]